ncbi:hypothetical protein V1460_06605 [Streptomyces sp. SCSIO 30461]|uniref:hypothetical protein n=1 Tax=Streptomyces sp. SCSIO 30461 TaxID=3118085 RepID=UPI0030D14418
MIVGSGGWSGALIAHGGGFANLTSPTAAPDGYEDILVRLKDNKTYLYAGNGLGEPEYATRRELAAPSSSAKVGGWKSVLQMITPGDIDGRTDSGYKGGNDLVTIQCKADPCTDADADLYLYSGKTAGDGAANQADPFDLGKPKRIGNGSLWLNRTILAIGDQDGDGIKDLLARDETTRQLIIFPGEKSASGTYSIDFDHKAIYGSGGWNKGNRPLLASAGNAQGVVRTFTDSLDGAPTQYRSFVPTTGESAGDLWATTPADPDLVIDYVTSSGAADSTTCPTGCLLFYPGGTTTHRSPRLVGTGYWSKTITGIF